MSERDDMARLGRESEHVSVPLREVFPWWFLSGAVTHFALIIALMQLSPSGSVLIIWGALIGITIRDRRAIVRRFLANDTAVTRVAVAGPRWLEPTMTGACLAIGLGLSLLLGSLFPPDGEQHAPPIAGGALIALGAVLICLVWLRTRRRR